MKYAYNNNNQCEPKEKWVFTNTFAIYWTFLSSHFHSQNIRECTAHTQAITSTKHISNNSILLSLQFTILIVEYYFGGIRNSSKSVMPLDVEQCDKYKLDVLETHFVTELSLFPFISLFLCILHQTQ